MAGSSRSLGSWIGIGFLVIAGFFLITEHTAHVFGILPFLLLLACLLLHQFSHRGHRHHSSEDRGHHHGGQPEEKGGTP